MRLLPLAALCRDREQSPFHRLLVTMTNRQLLFSRLVCYYEKQEVYFHRTRIKLLLFYCKDTVKPSSPFFLRQNRNTLLYLYSSFFIFYLSEYFLILFSVTVQQKGLNTLLHKDSLDKYQSIKVMSHRVSFSIRRGLVWRP
jgi:hypothetical protein